MRTILILMDSVTRKFLKPYHRNGEGITPNIESFARDSVRFDNHFIGSAPCMPARRDILTGRTQFLERGWGGIEPFDITLPEVLRQNGVFSHITTDHSHYFEVGGENYCYQFNTWDYQRGQEGDAWISRVNQPAVDQEAYGRKSPQNVLNREVYGRSEEQYPSPKTFRSACKWIEDNKGCDDFFLMVETFDPHEPFETPREYHDLYQDDYHGREFNWSSYEPVKEPAEAVEHLRKSYLATLTMADRWLGKFLTTLKEQGMYEDTLIILTTDHGHMLGEHGYIGKNYMHAYNEVAHIPLFLKMPDGSCGGECRKQLTQNIDLMPTILNYHRCEVPERVKGKNLFSYILEEDPGRDEIIYGWFGRAVNVYDGRYTYFRAPGNSDNQPCYQYCGMPTTLGRYLGEEYADQMEMGRFLPYTRYPVYKIPVLSQADILGDISFVMESRLFDVEEDYAQEHPMDDEVQEELMCQKLIRAMEEADSPKWQYERLNLEKRG